MIKVERSTAQLPKELTEEDSIGIKERDEVIKFYSDINNKEKAFKKYKAYKNPSVQQRLEEIFCGKCAYCESKYVRLHPVDVEHFRPKGQIVIDGKVTKPGYYWLASDWENLLPSCIDCNRERYQIQLDGTRIKTGKKDKFPIADEKKRAKNPGEEKHEKPLLLNPCIDAPEKHLEFTEEGIVRPKRGGKFARRAEQSIIVYGLQRRKLVEARKERATLVLAQIERVRELTEDLNNNINSVETSRRLEREMKALKEYLKPENEYTGMVKQLVIKFFESL